MTPETMYVIWIISGMICLPVGLFFLVSQFLDHGWVHWVPDRVAWLLCTRTGGEIAALVASGKERVHIFDNVIYIDGHQYVATFFDRIVIHKAIFARDMDEKEVKLKSKQEEAIKFIRERAREELGRENEDR